MENVAGTEANKNDARGDSREWWTGCEKVLRWVGSVAGMEANKIDAWKWRTGCEKVLDVQHR